MSPAGHYATQDAQIFSKEVKLRTERNTNAVTSGHSTDWPDVISELTSTKKTLPLLRSPEILTGDRDGGAERKKAWLQRIVLRAEALGCSLWGEKARKTRVCRCKKNRFAWNKVLQDRGGRILPALHNWNQPWARSRCPTVHEKTRQPCARAGACMLLQGFRGPDPSRERIQE